MTYALLKSGVYLQDIYFVNDLTTGKELLVEKVNEDRDDYHTWDLTKVVEAVSVDEWKVLYSLSKPVNNEFPKYDNGIVGIDPRHHHLVEVSDLKEVP